MSDPEVVVVGGAMVDIQYRVSNIPGPDGGAFASGVEQSFGGAGANVATALARLGCDVGLVSRVGADERGRRVREHLEAGPIDASHVLTGPEVTTHSLVFRDPEGQRSIVTAGDSYRNLELSAETMAYVKSADVVFVTAYTPDSVVSKIFDGAEENDFPDVAFGLSGAVEELRDRGTEPETIDRALDLAALFVSGEVASVAFFGDCDERAVERLSTGSVQRAALTRGAAGATLISDDRVTEIEAFDVDVVDTTGAGDGFVAGLIDRWLLADRSPENAGRFAAAVAAINCRHEFTQPGLPDMDAVERFLADHGVELA